MKKFFGLLLVVVVVVMTSSFVGVVFANMVLAKNNEHSTQLVVVEATATPSATVEPTAEATVTVEPTATPIAEPTATPIAEPTATPIVEATATPIVEATATPIVEAISEDPSQTSLGNFLTMSRSSDGSFNATPVGSQDGWVEFTDKDLMSHVGEQITVNVASQSLSVKLENKSHIYRRADVGQADFSVCPQHRALYRRHTSAYGDDIVITLSAEDITNIARYAAYWYNSDGELTYGLTICDCLVGKHIDTSSNGSSSGHHPSDEPTPAPTQEPVETPHPALDNTPEAPSETADNQPSHNEPVETPHPAMDNTPEAPSETASNQPVHNDVVNSNAVTVEKPSHSDLPGAEEVSEGTASAVADAVSAPEAPSVDFVASVASNDVPVAPANDLVASIPAAEAPAPVAEVDKVDVDEAMNVPSFSDMPTE